MVVFFDIDGTIVDDATQIIPESAVEAIGALRRNGHLPVVNTGRPYGHIDPRVRAMDIGGWICGCGMEVILNGSYLHRDYPSAETCRWVAREARRCGMLIQAEGETDLYYDGTMEYTGAPALEAERLRLKGIRVLPFQEVPDYRFVKFVTHDAPGCKRQEFYDAMQPEFDGIIRSGTMIEFVKKGNSKAKGMERLLNTLGGSKEETFAIGDSTNDLPMFRMAGTTICLGGGMEELKQEADYVTDTVLNDGIFKALKAYHLI